MKTVSLAAASAVILTGISAQAQPLSTYAANCAQQLGLDTIPGYTCSQPGASLMTSGQGFFILGQLANNWLGRVTTANPNVDAVFLCRGTSGNAQTANGYILQNTITGNTCFFDEKDGVSTTVPSPNKGPNASTFWADPVNMDGECQTCHSADPFIVSPGLAAAMKAQKMMRSGRNLKGAYNIVGSGDSSSHFSNWNAERLLVSQSGCALNCHNTSNNAGPSSWFTQAQPPPQGQGWMPPGAQTQNFVASTETPASIAVWRPEAQATFFFDRDGSHSWNSGDQWGAFGTTGDKPFVLRGTECAGNVRPLAEFGATRGSSWLVTKNNHFYDRPDDANTFSFGNSGEPFSWNGVAVSFQSSFFVIDYDNNRANSSNGADQAFAFGTTGDKPLVGRWKRGIGHRMGIFRQGGFALETNGNNIWDSADTSFQFGAATDIPFTGDFNGDGVDEIGVFRDGTWFVDLNNNFRWDGTAGDAQWFFGQAGDIPVVSPTKWNCSW